MTFIPSSSYQPCRARQPERGRRDYNKWRKYNVSPTARFSFAITGKKRIHTGHEAGLASAILAPVHRGIQSFELELDCEPLPGCVVSALRAGGRRGCRSVSRRGLMLMMGRARSPRQEAERG